MKRIKMKEYPLPPNTLLDHCQRGDGGIREYLRTSQISFQNLKDTLRQIKRDLYSFKNILDFGCGSSKVLRCFKDIARRCSVYGTDIDKEAINWNKKNIPFVNFYKVGQH